VELKDKQVVCVITGAGLKDPDIAVKCAEPPAELPADNIAIERALGLS